MGNWHTNHLINQRDGLLREAEHLEKRLKVIHEKVTNLNAQIPPIMPGQSGFQWSACPNCGSRSFRCGCD